MRDRHPSSDRPAPGRPASGRPAFGRAAPGVPAPDRPAPGVPAPGVPAPGRPAPDRPAPGVPAPGVPAPGVPAPGRPAPDRPAPGVPAPGVPAPGVPAPGVPAPGVPAPGVPAPATSTAATPPPTGDDAALWIGTLLQQFPELAVELVPGRTTPAPRAAAPPPPDLAERIRAEHAEALLLQQRHGLTAPGPGAAPLRLHISDTIRDITDGVIELEEAVRERLRLPRARRADVPARLRRITALLDDIAADPVLAGHVRDESRRMARRCARALGDTETVVRVAGRCPWCDSVSLRAFPERAAVLCVNPACRCSAPDCGCHDDPAYRHAWAQG
ncbi:hypothetical protein [Streptomyces sp. NPDC088785]|uniref:hypothetical protein n=1 Tax=Streptomyces sp. NPDC088785 TaxID=3365897 RepID=UPI003828D3E6